MVLIEDGFAIEHLLQVQKFSSEILHLHSRYIWHQQYINYIHDYICIIMNHFILIIVIIIISNIRPVLEDLLQIWDLDPGGHCSAQYCEQGAVRGNTLGRYYSKEGDRGETRFAGDFSESAKMSSVSRELLQELYSCKCIDITQNWQH